MGCMAQATQEWAIHTPDAAPRVTRIQVGNDLVDRGLAVRAEGDLVELPSGTTMRSGGLAAGWGWTDVAPNDCLAIGISLLGRIEVGRPAMTDPSSLAAGVGSRAELALTLAKDHTNESLTLIEFRPALVFGVETTTWTRLDPRFFDASAGVGLRFGVVSEAGPPLLKWLGTLL